MKQPVSEIPPRVRLTGRATNGTAWHPCSRMPSWSPTIVPPVPTPLTTASTRDPGISSTISRAVVSRWAAALSGFSNCRVSNAPRSRARPRRASRPPVSL